jgi:hypothetical protein
MQEHAGTCWDEELSTPTDRGRERKQGTVPSPLYHLARPNCIRVETGPGGRCRTTEFHYRNGVKPGMDPLSRLHAFLGAVRAVK